MRLSAAQCRCHTRLKNTETVSYELHKSLFALYVINDSLPWFLARFRLKLALVPQRPGELLQHLKTWVILILNFTRLHGITHIRGRITCFYPYLWGDRPRFPLYLFGVNTSVLRHRLEYSDIQWLFLQAPQSVWSFLWLLRLRSSHYCHRLSFPKVSK